MPRATNAPATRARRKKAIKKAKGYYGNKSRLYRYAKDATERAGKFAYRDRRKKKSEFRQLWIIRINAAVRPHDLSYSKFMHGLKEAKIGLDRKQLSEMAIHDTKAFDILIDQVKAALGIRSHAEKGQPMIREADWLARRVLSAHLSDCPDIDQYKCCVRFSEEYESSMTAKSVINELGKKGEILLSLSLEPNAEIIGNSWQVFDFLRDGKPQSLEFGFQIKKSGPSIPSGKVHCIVDQNPLGPIEIQVER